MQLESLDVPRDIIASMVTMLTSTREAEEMTHYGGAREGAGRPAKFEDRAQLHVYIERVDKEQLMSKLQFMRDSGDEETSISDILMNAAIEWMASVPEDRYRAWAGRNMDWIRRNYPDEYIRLKTT